MGLPELMQTYVDALPPGSYVALSHFYDPGGRDGERVRAIRQTMLDHGLDADYFRTREEIEALFPDSLDFLDPGLVVLRDWWPDGPLNEPLPVQRCILGALARKS